MPEVCRASAPLPAEGCGAVVPAPAARMWMSLSPQQGPSPAAATHPSRQMEDFTLVLAMAFLQYSIWGQAQGRCWGAWQLVPPRSCPHPLPHSPLSCSNPCSWPARDTQGWVRAWWGRDIVLPLPPWTIQASSPPPRDSVAHPCGLQPHSLSPPGSAREMNPGFPPSTPQRDTSPRLGTLTWAEDTAHGAEKRKWWLVRTAWGGWGSISGVTTQGRAWWLLLAPQGARAPCSTAALQGLEVLAQRGAGCKDKHTDSPCSGWGTHRC